MYMHVHDKWIMQCCWIKLEGQSARNCTAVRQRFELIHTCVHYAHFSNTFVWLKAIHQKTNKQRTWTALLSAEASSFLGVVDHSHWPHLQHLFLCFPSSGVLGRVLQWSIVEKLLHACTTMMSFNVLRFHGSCTDCYPGIHASMPVSVVSEIHVVNKFYSN